MKVFVAAGFLGIGMLFSLSAPAEAQLQGPGNGGLAPNIYNRQTQPLSPYLNLLRGGNNAVNYFYGVRPGLATGGYGLQNGGYGFLGRQTFFPQIDTLYELEDVAPGDGLQPTGHPVGFNNTLGHFGAGLGTSLRSNSGTSGGYGSQGNQDPSQMAPRRTPTGTGK